MFATRGSTTPGGQATRQQRATAFLVLALLVLGSLLVLLSGCGTLGTDNSTVTAPVTQSQSVLMRVHLAPTPTNSTTVRTAQRHLYTFATSNVGLMQPAVDAQGNVWVGEMHANLCWLLRLSVRIIERLCQ